MGEGNEVKERGGNRPWRKTEREEREGRAQSVQCRRRCTEQDGGRRETRRSPSKTGNGIPQDRKYRCRRRGGADGPFCRTETSRNLTKSFTENNNIDLNHQRVIWLRKGKVEMRF